MVVVEAGTGAIGWVAVTAMVAAVVEMATEAMVVVEAGTGAIGWVAMTAMVAAVVEMATEEAAHEVVETVVDEQR